MSMHKLTLGPVAAAATLLLAAAGAMLSGGHGTTASAADVGVLAATAGCGRAPTLANGTHTIQSGGMNRSFILRLPDNYNNNQPYRLVFGFHWLNGSANDVASGGSDGAAWAYYGLHRLANNSTIFVAPQGLNAGWANSGGQDLTFVDDMVRLLDGALCIDTTQRFATGFSYGGGMSFALACARPTVFRAVAVLAGAQLSGCNGGTQPIAYFGVHGISDSVLNISQGRSLRDRFVTNNGCTRQNPPEPAQGSRTHTLTTYTGCRAGYPVVWAAFDGDHTPTPVDGSSSPNGSRTWVPAETWRFFTQFEGTSPTTPPTTPPTTTPTTTPPTNPPTTPPPGTGACRVTTTINSWNTGLTESITITNTGTTAINGWSLVFTLPGGQTITSGWNAAYSPTSGQVTARNAAYNGTIAPNASVSIGFQATHSGNTARPTSFTLNGATCTTA
ncbi:cellulose binding domain-containing protein [Plantactinospora sonchi]|uniref:Cellulose binding domain-containing protein n=1 Tax=Plantactinospora sonchi TaxID=1544735 RepID=A0ABU7RME3_9ACTN